MFSKKKQESDFSFEDKRPKTEVYDVGLSDVSKAVISGVVAAIAVHEQYDRPLTEMYYDNLNKQAYIDHIRALHNIPAEIEDVDGWLIWHK